ncbi:Coiled-coil domain-containing protein [Dirofilaria immitis]|nr:Coiled-coil domain-containing protein [Dirofilaria immitis]
MEFLVDFNAKKREQEKRCLDDAEKPKDEESEAVHFNPDEEQRVYGVSHVPLPVSETKRQEQIQELLELSKKTEINREKRKYLLEEREKKKWEQLNRIRKRKGLQELPPWNSEEDNETKFLDIPLPDKQPTEAAAAQPEPKKFTPVREWDRGKVLYDRWITKQRDERNDEFAPPSSYFK